MDNVSPNDQTDIRSQDIQEILGRPPHSLVKWGITVFFFALVGLLLVSWFIRYPDLLTAHVTLTTTPPPITLVTRVSGSLLVNIADSAEVKQGQVLGFVRSNASPEEVLLLESGLLSQVDLLNLNFGSLGELQPFFSDHLNSLQTLNRFTQNRSYEKQISQLQKQQSTNEKLRRFLKRQDRLINEEMRLGKEKYKTDSVLFTQRVISTLDFNQAKSTWLQQQRSARNIESELLNNESRQNDLDKQITDLEIRMSEEDQKLRFSVEQSRRELIARIAKWKETYLLIASISGRVAYLGFLEMEQFVEPAKPIVSLIPSHGKLVAKAELPVRASGKAKEGQLVNIRLENFPFEQFGMLRGKISKISSLPIEGKYLLTIDLPNGLITTQNKEIKFKQQLTGTTQIITEDLRLLDRFVYQLRRLLQARGNAQ